MARLQIEVSDEFRKAVKVHAGLHDQTIGEFVEEYMVGETTDVGFQETYLRLQEDAQESD